MYILFCYGNHLILYSTLYYTYLQIQIKKALINALTKKTILYLKYYNLHKFYTWLHNTFNVIEKGWLGTKI